MESNFPQGLDLSKIPSMLPPPGLQPDFVDPTTLAEPIVAISSTTSALAIILLSARLYSTVRITRSTGYDDCACIAAIIFSLAYMSLIVNTRRYARHTWDMPITEYASSFEKIVFSQIIIGAMSLMFAKLSVLFLLFRLFSPNRLFRFAIYFGIAWATLISLTSIIVSISLCAPHRKETFGSLTLVARCGR